MSLRGVTARRASSGRASSTVDSVLTYAARKDMKAVAARLGHTSTRMIDTVYVELYADAGRDLATAIDTLVAERLAANVDQAWTNRPVGTPGTEGERGKNGR
jgi:hypothetical protein